ncbi:hypothetical protein BCR32DRAFT_283652 [Anaeromyces robustus]|uniref:Uncharacterized protein n=1 Tax=Anaeromyces robustus TaxID=1754192 RepID=A0A1Y1WUP2_9FUNG|nr:hypothetical protein BCR32DRAFT_283652 [Anaeromyces robustus]|eukprot:ORX76936.1 hypothetical protein BCR32DRAFT_283652 [Anaeromyces robustus]
MSFRGTIEVYSKIKIKAFTMYTKIILTLLIRTESPRFFSSQEKQEKKKENHYGNSYNSRFVEVIGQITGDYSITETALALSLGDNFDLESFDKLIQYQRKFPDIF